MASPRFTQRSGEQGGVAPPAPLRPLRLRPAANDNRAPLLRRLLLPLLALTTMGGLAAALYGLLA